MKIIFKSIIYIIFFLMMMVVFLPKENLYFLMLDKLKEYKVTLVQDKIETNLFSFSLDNINLKYNTIKTSDIKQVKLDMLVYKTQCRVDSINIDDSFKRFVPNKIDYIIVKHSILNPLFVDIDTKFNMGTATGTIDILNRVIHLDIKVSKRFKKEYRILVKQLKYSKDKSNSKQEVYSFEYKY